MNTILLSIIIPIYNVEKYLSRCLESIISQYNNDVELILIDDGSTDNSEKIYMKYVKKYKFIKFIKQKNAGLSEARNIGMKNSKAEYILFLDSDDYLETNSLSKVYKYLLLRKYDIVLCNGYRIVSGKKNLIRINKDDDKIYSGINYLINSIESNSYYPAVWLNIYSRKYVMENNLFFKKGRLHEDVEWFPRALKYANKVIITNIILYNYEIRENSITTRTDTYKNGLDIIQNVMELEKEFIDLPRKKKKIFYDYLSNQYLNGIFIGKLNDNEYDKFYPLLHSYRLKTRLKSILFLLNKRLFYIVRDKMERNNI